MNKFEFLSVLFAALSFIGSLWAMRMSWQANSTNKRMFKRQGVIDLHMAWQGVSEIDPKKLITPDIVKAVNALGLTATLWNHDVIEKSILYQSYWKPYKDLYDTLYALNELVPGKKETCRSLITSEITKAYHAMRDVDIKAVVSTKI